MAVVFDEVIANVEAPANAPPPEASPAEAAPASAGHYEIIDAIETRQRRAERLQAD